MDTKQFFQTLFPVLDGNVILIWDSMYISQWAHSHDDAVEYAMKSVDRKVHSYFGLGLAEPRGKDGKKRRTDKRAKTDEIVAIPGLWADIDISGGVHDSGKNYPETIERAKSLILQLPLYPSLLVETGGGLHAYWLFDHLLKITNENERYLASELSFKWQSLIRHIFNLNGAYTIDSTADLARILRVPGTKNFKYTPPKDVQVTEYDVPVIRYKPSEIKEILKGYQLPEYNAPRKKSNTAELKFGQEKEILEMTTDRKDDILEAIPEIQKLWARPMRTKPNAKGEAPDNSMSSFEMSIANYAAAAGLEDTEIFQLLIRFRSDHGQPRKHLEYYQTTISKAKREKDTTQASKFIAETVNEIVAGAVAEDEIDNQEVMESLTAQLGMMRFPIIKIMKLLSEPPLYKMRCLNTKSDILIGSIANIMTENNFRMQVADSTRHLIPKIGKEWNNVAQLILHVCEDVELGFEATAAGMHISLMRDFFTERRILEYSIPALISKNPFRKDDDGMVYFVAQEYKMWAKHSRDMIFKDRDFFIGLKSAGAEFATVRIDLDGYPKKSNHYWRIKESIINTMG